MTLRILVTGGSGLVGYGVRAALPIVSDISASWHFVGSRDADLRDPAQTNQLFDRIRPTHVLHLAAKVGGLFNNMRQKVEFFRDNMAMTLNITDACHRYGVQKLVSCLSTCIFPDDTPYPIDESMVHSGPPHSSNYPYAYAKRMIDVLNSAYSEQHGLAFTSVIPTNIFGPHDNFHLEDAHVIPALIHKCHLAQQTGSPFVVSGTGSPLRQFLFSEDLGRLLVWTLLNYEDSAPLILSVDESAEISIGDLARMIAIEMGFTGEVQFDTSRPDGQFKKTASNAKLRGLLPDFHFTPMQEGLRRSVRWFLNNQETFRH
jgi:GDP-L-fucose synthase